MLKTDSLGDAKLYCTCKTKWSESDGDNMVLCECCEEWLHYKCAGVIPEKVKLVKKFVCMQCSMKLFEQSQQAQMDGKVSKQIHELQQLNHQLDQDKAISCDEISQLKNANNELREQVNSFSVGQGKSEQMKVEIKRLNDQIEATNQEVEKREKDLQEKIKTLNATSNSLEVMNKRCATLEKSGVTNERLIESLRDQIDEYKQKDVDRQTKIDELEHQLADHLKINKDLIANSCNKCKEKASEITSLKRKLDNMEKIEKSNNKQIQELSTKIYEAERRLKREEKINDFLMKIDDNSTQDPSAQHKPHDESQNSPTIENYGAQNNPHESMNALTNGNPNDKDSVSGRPRHDQSESSSIAQPKNLTDQEGVGHSGNIESQFCEVMFLNGLGSSTGCNKRHDYDLSKLARGPCVYELRRKKSCTKRDDCKFCHQIPPKYRNDKALIAQAYEKKNKKNNPPKDEIVAVEVCPNEFYGGKSGCQISGCPLKHDLDRNRISKGPCCYEYFKKDSCPYGANCRFTHELPIDCLQDRMARAAVLVSIHKLKNKTQAVEILGRQITEEAERNWSNAPSPSPPPPPPPSPPPPSRGNYNTFPPVYSQPVSDQCLSTGYQAQYSNTSHENSVAPSSMQIPSQTPEWASSQPTQLPSIVDQATSLTHNNSNNNPQLQPWSSQTSVCIAPAGAVPHQSFPNIPDHISSFLRHCVKEHLSKESLIPPLSNHLQQTY